MKTEGYEEAEGLSSYGKDTVGGIMFPDFIALQMDTTTAGAIAYLQKNISMWKFLTSIDIIIIFLIATALLGL